MIVICTCRIYSFINIITTHKCTCTCTNRTLKFTSCTHETSIRVDMTEKVVHCCTCSYMYHNWLLQRVWREGSKGRLKHIITAALKVCSLRHLYHSLHHLYHSLRHLHHSLHHLHNSSRHLYCSLCHSYCSSCHPYYSMHHLNCPSHHL